MTSRFFTFLVIAFLLDTAYIAAFAEPTIFYMANVVAHLVGGIILTILAVWMLPRALWMTLAVGRQTSVNNGATESYC